MTLPGDLVGIFETFLCPDSRFLIPAIISPTFTAGMAHEIREVQECIAAGKL